MVFLNKEDRLHRHMCNLFVLMEAYAFTVTRINDNKSELPGQIIFPSRRMNLQISIPLGDFVPQSMNGGYPDDVWFLLLSDMKAPDVIISTSSAKITDHIFLTLVGSQLVLFIEEHWEWMRIRYGNQYDQWPPLMNFARVVRNAASHNGILDLKKISAPLTWKEFTFYAEDSGKHIFGSVMRVADLILLMLEVAEELDREGAPSLVWEPPSMAATSNLLSPPLHPPDQGR